MPSWKKVIVSGSDASVRTLFAANSVTSSIFSGSQYIGTSFTGSVFSGSRYIGASFTGSLSGSITPPGSNTTVMYNNNGVLAGSTNFIFDGTNVGIGATSPLARLHAGPNLSDTSNYSFTNTGAVIASFGVDHTAARTNVLSLMRDGTSGVVYAGLAAFDISRWSADSVNARTQLDIRLANTDTNTLTDVISLRSDGNVGIGTTSPTGSLQVNGILSISNNAVIGQGNNYGTIGAANFTTLKLYDSSTGDTLLNNQGYNIQLQTAGSSKLTILNAGNVGIGTTSPSNPLHVEKDAGGNAIAYFNSLNADGYGVAIRTTDTGNDKYVLRLDSNSGATPVMYATNAGNVGIGTISPQTKLHVSVEDTGNTYPSSASINIANYQSAAFGRTMGINFGVGNSSPSEYIAGIYGVYTSYSTSTGGALAFITNNGSGLFTEKMRITSTGNVGIGTITPGAKLDVIGQTFITSNTAALRLSGSDHVYIEFYPTNSLGRQAYFGFPSAGSKDFYMANESTNGHIILATNGTGNVGIGNTSPSTRLHVAGSTQSTAASGVARLGFADSSSVALFTNADTLYGTLFGTLSSGKGWIQQQRVDGTATAYDLALQPNGGNVGIGTASPNQKLEVAGGNGSNQVRISYDADTRYYNDIKNQWDGGVVANNQMVFKIGTGTLNTTTDVMTLVGNGKVGIGATTPGANLQIGYQNSSTSEMLRLGVIYTGSPTQRGVISWHDSADVTGQIDTRFDGTKVNMHFGSLYNNAYNSTVRMTILGDGNVGIGTTTPSTALQVNGTVSASAFQLGPVQYAARRYSSTVSNITTGSYTTLFNVYGDALSSAIKVVVRGTANSVVIDSIIDITANHLDDIVIKSQSGIYTLLTIKVLAAGSNTEDFTVQAKIGNHEPAQPLTAYVDVYPYGNEVIEFNPGFAYSSAVLEHDCLPGFNHNSTGGTAYFNINNKARIESTENSDTTPTLYLEGNKGGSSPYTATLIELKSNIDYRGRGITMSTGDTNARWFAGVPYAGASYQIGYDSSGALPYDQGNSALLIDSSKNVLIGATSAGGKLDIAGTTGATVYARTNGADWNTGIRVQTNNANGGYFHMSFVSGSQYASLQAGDNSAYRSISLNHVGGNVGIGTIAPVSKLQVDGNIGSDYTISDISNYYRNIKPRGGVYNTQTTTITGAIKITYPVGYTNTMHHIKVRVYEYSTNRSFTINFGGYNYAPTPSWYNCFAYIEGDAATDINHAVRFGYDGSKMVVYIGELASSWTYPQVFIDEVAVGYGGYSSAWSTDAWSVGFEASAFANVTATVSDTKAHVFARNGTYAYYNLGDVAIGSTTPSYKLDVLGTIRATGDVIAYSDARVKNNVQPINNALQKVLSLRGVSYTRKDTDDKSTKIGVIAQEVLPVLPEVVSKDDNGNYSVSYGNMVGLLIEAIKEQQKEIDELKYLLKDKKNKK